MIHLTNLLLLDIKYILVAKLFFLVSVNTYDCFSKIKLYEWNARSKGILIALQKYYSSLHI